MRKGNCKNSLWIFKRSNTDNGLDPLLVFQRDHDRIRIRPKYKMNNVGLIFCNTQGNHGKGIPIV